MDDKTIGESLFVFFDGLCEPRNPGGIACGGWVIMDHPAVPARAGHRVYRQGPEATNNIAEYEAALDALRAVYKAGWRGPLVLTGDSQLVVKQATGAWACNAPHLIELRDRLRHAMTFFARVEMRWVPRDSNTLADEQARLAYERARKET